MARSRLSPAVPRRSREPEPSAICADDETMAQTLRGPAAAFRRGFPIESVGEMAAQVEPGDGRREHDARSRRLHADRNQRPAAHRTRCGCPTASDPPPARASKADSAGAGGEAEQPSGQREQGGLDHHFADDVPPARAQRLPDRDFLQRPLARISSRFTRLTAPISSRANAPACINSKSGADARDVIGVKGHHQGTKAGIGHHLGLRDRPLPSVAFCASICDCACARVAPGLRRAIMCLELPPECRSRGSAIFGARGKRKIDTGFGGEETEAGRQGRRPRFQERRPRGFGCR